MCPAGRHPMDPGWDECPYCRSEPTGGASNRRATIIETPPRGTEPERPEPAAGPRSLPPRPQPPPPAPPTPAAEPAAPGRDAKTRFESPGGEQRRIVALLVTFSWQPGGEVHPVREGRNYLGSGEDCEVRLAHDPQLSARHATIVYRGQDFWIDDETSMNGTFVDGEIVEERRRLANYAEVRTGATSWRFVVVDPPAASTG
jgi:FHA domain